jgi:hypothetical protein
MIVFTKTRDLPGNRSIRILGTLAFSGNYVAGGEVPTGIIKPGTTKNPFNARISGKGTHDFKYDNATGKVLVYLAGVEHAAAAYVAGVTGDSVVAEIEYPKGG